MSEIVKELFVTAEKSLAKLRAEISGVRYATHGILFEFRGKTFKAPEPYPEIPSDRKEANQSIALKMLLDKKAKPTG